jgi:tetratricopeptide (TPR) repeat protein
VSEDLASVSVRDPFSILSLFVAGPPELTRYGNGAPLLVDDTMRLEFSAPRELHNQRAGDNVASLMALYEPATAPSTVRESRTKAGVAEWRQRGAMMFSADVFGRAYDDYLAALQIDASDTASLEGFVRTAAITGRSSDALTALRGLLERRHSDRHGIPGLSEVAGLVALSKLEAASGARDDALITARKAMDADPASPAGVEQVASLMADAGDTVRLDQALETLQQRAPDAAPTHYYRAVSHLLHGRLPDAMVAAERGIALHPSYAPFYDLAGAIYTKRGEVFRAKWAFDRSLSFDAHDSTAYENLGLIALEEGDMAAARNYFAEALWLVPDSRVALEGMRRLTND